MAVLKDWKMSRLEQAPVNLNDCYPDFSASTYEVGAQIVATSQDPVWVAEWVASLHKTEVLLYPLQQGAILRLFSKREMNSELFILISVWFIVACDACVSFTSLLLSCILLMWVLKSVLPCPSACSLPLCCVWLCALFGYLKIAVEVQAPLL